MSAATDPPVLLDPARCVHGLLAAATCDACVQACPFEAWSIGGNGLELAQDRCDGCGRCLAVCPERALSLPVWQLQRRSTTVLEVTCDHCAAPPATASRLPCLHALGVAELGQMYEAGVRTLHTLKGDCGSCARGGGEGLEDRLAIFNAMLAARVAEPLACTDEPAAPPQPTAPAGPSPGARRAFFRTLVRDPVRAFATTPAALQPLPPATPTAAGTLLARLGVGPLPHAPAIDTAACTFCRACVRVCPHGALRLHERGVDAGSEATLFLAAPACTGCRLCEDACDDDAIRVTDWSIARQTQVELRRARCAACGAPFLHLADAESAPRDCPICVKTRHTRRLHQRLDE